MKNDGYPFGLCLIFLFILLCSKSLSGRVPNSLERLIPFIKFYHNPMRDFVFKFVNFRHCPASIKLLRHNNNNSILFSINNSTFDCFRIWRGWKKDTLMLTDYIQIKLFVLNLSIHQFPFPQDCTLYLIFFERMNSEFFIVYFFVHSYYVDVRVVKWIADQIDRNVSSNCSQFRYNH